MDTFTGRLDIHYSLTDRERQMVSILLAEPDGQVRSSMRHALVSLGYEEIIDASDHTLALEKLDERSFTHLIFDARTCFCHPREFLTLVFQKTENIVALPSSADPTVDDVFDLLIGGARGYIVKPFTSGTLEEAIVWATKGESISDAILQASSRNEALAFLTLAALDKLALIMKQSREFDTAKREIPRRKAIFKRAIDIARTFAKGGELEIIEAFQEAAVKKASSQGAHNVGVRRRRRRNSSAPNGTLAVPGV